MLTVIFTLVSDLNAGVVSQATGSAYIEMGQTKVIAAVYGPREIARREEFTMKGRLCCELKFATFACRRRRQHIQDNQEKDGALIVLQALEPAVCLDRFPKSQVDVYITVLQDDGSGHCAPPPTDDIVTVPPSHLQGHCAPPPTDDIVTVPPSH
uniref:Exoribonuclease phosphorolytic domain-containing protein n=1 Tax=Branchiostoma floridae TaxID=7739 RepID=C3ZZA1_BRAFL|eukprot:XP_002586113.1 hypothetical protein BRAFLDRAFT_109996 [Branchiostoma floridae]